MHMYFVISALFLTVNGHRPHLRNHHVWKKCDSILLDRCGFQIYGILHRPSVFPQNRADLIKACRSMVQGLECVKQRLAECPTVMSSKLSPQYLRNLPKIIVDICKRGGIGEKLIPFGDCYKKKLRNFKCPQQFFNDLEAAREEPTSKEKHFATCCGSDKYGSCTNMAVTLNCGPEAAAAKRALAIKLSGFLVDYCVPVQQNAGYQRQCAAFKPKPLPGNRRVVSNVLPALVDVFGHILGP